MIFCVLVLCLGWMLVDVVSCFCFVFFPRKPFQVSMCFFPSVRCVGFTSDCVLVS